MTLFNCLYTMQFSTYMFVSGERMVYFMSEDEDVNEWMNSVFMTDDGRRSLV